MIPVPVEAHQAIVEPVPDVLPESDPPLTSTVEQLAEPAFRLAESVTVTPMAAEVPHPESAQPVTEFHLQRESTGFEGGLAARSCSAGEQTGGSNGCRRSSSRPRSRPFQRLLLRPLA